MSTNDNTPYVYKGRIKLASHSELEKVKSEILNIISGPNNDLSNSGYIPWIYDEDGNKIYNEIFPNLFENVLSTTEIHVKNNGNIITTRVKEINFEGNDISLSANSSGEINCKLNELQIPTKHFLYLDDIKTSNIPFLSAADDTIINNYVNKIKKYTSLSLNEIQNSSGLLYNVYDSDNNITISNFINPEDKIELNPYTISNGYKVKLLSGTSEIPESYGWKFDYKNGIVHFSKKFNDQYTDKSNFKLSGITYLGETLSDLLNKKSEIEVVDFNVAPSSNFLGTSSMTRVYNNVLSADYQIPFSDSDPLYDTWIKKYYYVVEGICLNSIQITNKLEHEGKYFTISPEIEYIGIEQNKLSSVIYVDLPCDKRNGDPIIGEIINNNQRYLKKGEYKFRAIVLKCNNFEVVDNSYDYTDTAELVYPPTDYNNNSDTFATTINLDI